MSRATLLLFGSCAAAEASSQCWVPEATLSFEACCREFNTELKGNPGCWLGEFTYKSCCIPEFDERIQEGIRLISDGHFGLASDMLFKLMYNYATVTAAPQHYTHAFNAFQKAAYNFRKELDALPHTLSYFEILFAGLGIDCDAAGADPRHLDPYSEFARCCENKGFFTHRACQGLFEMMARALGPARHQTPVSLHEYYGNMSEQWAFHHFTPSVLTGGDLEVALSLSPLERAHEINSDLASALEASEEPALGIVWARHVSYVSPKFKEAVFDFTLLFDAMIKAGANPVVDIFEIGAGFGCWPRILAFARERLSKLADPVYVRSYAVFDVRSAIDLQRWYLNNTARSVVEHRDWMALENEWVSKHELNWDVSQEVADAAWPEVSMVKEPPSGSSGIEAVFGEAASRFFGSPLRVEFVDAEHRELFTHLYSEAHATEVDQSSKPGTTHRNTRALIAVNSWHEFPTEDFLWFYNAFVAAPAWRMGVEWILYISNRQWPQNDVKEALLMRKRSHFSFEIYKETCTEVTCTRLLRRVS